MKKVIILLVAMLVGSSFQLVEAQNSKDPFVHCLVLDKTLSMKGYGGTDIWADVQNYCCEWVDDIPQSSTMLLFTYDKDLYGPQAFEIKSDADRQRAKDAIKNINVDGKHTWIASNLDKAFEYVLKNYPNNNKMFYLVTDGIEEQKESDFAGVLKRFAGRRGDYDHLYYVDLRDMADAQTQTVLDTTKWADWGSGFTKFANMTTALSEINFNYDKTKSFEQIFVVSNGEVIPEMYFNIRIESTKNTGDDPGVANVTITPSKVKIEDMDKITDGQYKMNFNVDFLNNSRRDCDIHVILVGQNEGETILTFEPNDFCIKARKADRPKIDLKKDINGQPQGWHFKK